MKPVWRKLLYVALFYVVWFATTYLIDTFRKPNSANDFGSTWLIFLVFIMVAIIWFLVCLYHILRGSKDHIWVAALHLVMLIIIINYFFI